MRKITTAALAMSLLVAACGGDGPTGPGNIEGTYALRSVNGTNVPATAYQSGTYRLELLSGAIAINSGNTFSNTLSIRETDGAQSASYTLTCTGTFVRNGSSITLTEAETTDGDCGGSYTGTFGGSMLTVAYDANVQAVYSR